MGTPRFGTNSGGSQVWAWGSDAFGNGAPSGAATVNLRMPGQYYDAESGLFYNWNRYYNPAIGRYISSDPIGLEGGLNTFNYVEQSPLMYTDPEGLNIFWMGARITIAACVKIPACRNRIVSEAAKQIAKRAEQAPPPIPYIPQTCNMDDPTGTGNPPLYVTDGTQLSQDTNGNRGSCSPPAGTICYFFDQVPPSRPHYPYSGNHYHLYRYNQLPDGSCKWNSAGVVENVPIGAMPCPFARTGGR